MLTARYVLHSTFCSHSVFMCFVWIWEQIEIFSLYSFNWLVGFYNCEAVCLLRGTFYILRSAHTVYLCVLYGSENKYRLFHCTALTDGLVFTNEMQCVYCAVRTVFVSTIPVYFPVQCYYWFLTDFVCSSTSRILQWTPPNSKFNVPILPATCVIPIYIIQFNEQISSQPTF